MFILDYLIEFNGNFKDLLDYLGFFIYIKLTRSLDILYKFIFKPKNLRLESYNFIYYYYYYCKNKKLKLKFISKKLGSSMLS